MTYVPCFTANWQNYTRGEKNFLIDYKAKYSKMTAYGITNDCYDLNKKYKWKNITEGPNLTPKRNWWNRNRTNWLGVFPKLTIENNDPNLKVCNKNECYCENGTPTELCSETDLHKCKSCNTGYYLYGGKCWKEKTNICPNGTPSEGNEFTTKDGLKSCKACNDGYRLIPKSINNTTNDESMMITEDYDPREGYSGTGKRISGNFKMKRYLCVANKSDGCLAVDYDKNRSGKINGRNAYKRNYFLSSQYTYSDGDPVLKYNKRQMCKSCPDGFVKYTRNDLGWTIKRKSTWSDAEWEYFEWVNNNESYCVKDRQCECPNGVGTKRSIDGISLEKGCPMNAKYGCKSCDEGYEKIFYQKARNNDTNGGLKKNIDYWQGPVCVDKKHVRLRGIDTDWSNWNKFGSCKAKNFTPLTQDECNRSNLISYKDKSKTSGSTFIKNGFFGDDEWYKNDFTYVHNINEQDLKGCFFGVQQISKIDLPMNKNKTGRRACRGDTLGVPWPKNAWHNYRILWAGDGDNFNTDDENNNNNVNTWVEKKVENTGHHWKCCTNGETGTVQKCEKHPTRNIYRRTLKDKLPQRVIPVCKEFLRTKWLPAPPCSRNSDCKSNECKDDGICKKPRRCTQDSDCDSNKCLTNNRCANYGIPSPMYTLLRQGTKLISD
jgi:hypothetical protein